MMNSNNLAQHLLPAGQNETAVVLLSGGLDSTVALFLAKNLGFHPVALEFNYTSNKSGEKRPAAEGQRVSEICTVAGVDLYRILYPTAIMATTSAPAANRSFIMSESNQIYYTLAAAFAVSMRAKYVIAGQIKCDWYERAAPECRPEFYEILNKLLYIEYGSNAPHIHTPLIHLSKTEVVELGRRMNVPLDMTWSCLSSTEEPCLACHQCVAREKALRESEANGF